MILRNKRIKCPQIVCFRRTFLQGLSFQNQFLRSSLKQRKSRIYFPFLLYEYYSIEAISFYVFFIILHLLCVCINSCTVSYDKLTHNRMKTHAQNRYKIAYFKYLISNWSHKVSITTEYRQYI